MDASVPLSWRVWSIASIRPGGHGVRAARLVRSRASRSGSWQVRDSNNTVLLNNARLCAVWQTAFWITLQLKPHSNLCHGRITVCRCSVAPAAWRQLCLWATRDLAMMPVHTETAH